MNFLKKMMCAVVCYFMVSSCVVITPTVPEDINPAKWDSNYKDFYEVPSDPKATKEAKHLLKGLLAIRGSGVLFGHTESTQRGLAPGWADKPSGDLGPNEELSDVKFVCGDYPAMIGWDMPYDDSFMGKHMKNAYLRGGVNLVGWHPDNFTRSDGSNSWTSSAGFSKILPGGEFHETYMAELDARAALFNSITADRDGDGIEEKIPFIFKLYHEHNGVWFWWGSGNNSSSDFIKLWKMTVDRFRITNNCHQILFSYSPDVFVSPVDYLDRYPGSDYVDIIGHDNYHFSANSVRIRKALKDVSLIGRAFGKPAGLTEMGQYVRGGITANKFWTENILVPFTYSDIQKEITFALFWRNDNPSHYFVAYPGHPSAPDFVDFYKNKHTLFQAEATKLLYPE